MDSVDLEWIEAKKREMNLVILAHNYQRPEVQDIADMLGDSLALARQAAQTDADYIIFCGVDFMAESAKILSPQKTVLHPNVKSCCPMAAMITPEQLEEFKREHPGAPVVSYVNTTADIKALSDICCTSGNAVDVVRSVDSDEVIFVPDENLGLYVQRFVPEKKLHVWPGYCHVHADITLAMLEGMKKKYPGAVVMVHPECTPDVIDYSDHVFSTEGMLTFAGESDAGEFIVGTEEGLVHRMSCLMGEKTFHRVEEAVCPNMKKITLDDVVRSIKEGSAVVELPDGIITKARLPLEKMMDVKRSA